MSNKLNARTAKAVKSLQDNDTDSSDLPFTVARIMPMTTTVTESYQLPNGKHYVDEDSRAAVTGITIELSKPILTKDKSIAYQDRVYNLRLPCSTDKNDATRDGHNSADVVRALLTDNNLGHFFDLIPISTEEIKRERELSRDKDLKATIAQREKVVESLKRENTMGDDKSSLPLSI